MAEITLEERLKGINDLLHAKLAEVKAADIQVQARRSALADLDQILKDRHRQVSIAEKKYAWLKERLGAGAVALIEKAISEANKAA
jgi:hypothetical protein